MYIHVIIYLYMLPHLCAVLLKLTIFLSVSLFLCLQHTAIQIATDCNRLQHSATHGRQCAQSDVSVSLFLYLCVFMSTMQYTATQTATHCNTLQHTATHCNTHCNTLQHFAIEKWQCAQSDESVCLSLCLCVFMSAMQHTATHTATHRNILPHSATPCNTLQHPATPCTTLQHPAPPCNTLQHTATPCTTVQHTGAGVFNLTSLSVRPSVFVSVCLQHTATHCNAPQHVGAGVLNLSWYRRCWRIFLRLVGLAVLERDIVAPDPWQGAANLGRQNSPRGTRVRMRMRHMNELCRTHMN